MYLKKKSDDNDLLCCCEYINENNERSHILAAFCDCEAIDTACDRLCKWQNIDSENINKIMSTVSDRLRIPWIGGAKKLPLEIAVGIVCLLFTILLAALSWTSAIITYVLLLPTFLYSVHRYLRKDVESSGKIPRSQFYFVWFVLSISLLIIIFYCTVIRTMKITAMENLIFLSFSITSNTFLFVTKLTSTQGFVIQEESEDLIESGAWRICNTCQHQVPRQASHCRTCDVCYLLRDHHCIWLDTCISHSNDRWFVLGLVFGLIGLLYGSYLTFTTICHPVLLHFSFFTVLYPAKCPNAYHTWLYSMAASAGLYALIIALCVALILIKQTVCIISGVKLREYRVRRQLPGGISLTLKKAAVNCFEFWIR